MNATTLMQRSDLLLYSIFLDIFIIIYVSLLSSKSEYSSRLFIRIVALIAIITFFEAVTMLCSDYGNASHIPYRYWSNFLFLISTNLPAGLAVTYMDYKVLGDEKGCKKRFFFYLIPTYIALLSGIINFFVPGILFSVSPDNIYSRGIFVYVNIVTMYLMLAIVSVVFYNYKHMISGRTISSILIFFVVPIIGSILQAIFQGVAFGMPSYTLSAVAVLLILEKDELGKDDLTGLYTRQKMEARLRFKLKAKNPFILIMADLDGFKNINDVYGHGEGDKALKMTADLLRKAINIEDLVCRYGGDEFLIIVENEKDISQMVIDRISNAFDRINKKTKYHLGCSYGYEYVKDPQSTNLDDLLQRVDKKMYLNKASNKAKGVAKGLVPTN